MPLLSRKILFARGATRSAISAGSLRAACIFTYPGHRCVILPVHCSTELANAAHAGPEQGKAHRFSANFAWQQDPARLFWFLRTGRPP